MKRKIKRKRWLDRRSVILGKKKTKRNKVGFSYKKVGNTNKAANKRTYIATAPSIFSFIENTEETNQFFLNIVQEMKKKIYNQLFFIDSSKVNTVTTDALIYILALLYNIKLNQILKYSFKGNLPANKQAEKVYIDSGFVNYVRMKRAVMPQTDDKIQIITGSLADTSVAAKMCDFVNARFGTNPFFTKGLYPTLVELMSNTVSHAYNGKGIMVPHWFLYAVDKGDVIQFTFIDTGEGIPNTVRKKMLERIMGTTDSDLIYSAFMGDSRTETKLPNRGHGLPDLYQKVVCGSLQNFHVFSGKGCCKSAVRDEQICLEKIEYKQEIIGTIFQFEIVNS